MNPTVGIRHTIFMYHKIAVPGPHAKVRGHYVRPTEFRRHLATLRKLNLPIIPLADVGSDSAPARAIALTFDDGYQNFLTEAVPILREFGAPATVFAVTDRLGQTDTWDGGSEPLLTPSELTEVVRLGFEVGSHTRTHVNLAEVSAAVAGIEINDSRHRLEDLLQISVQSFCYPYGGIGPDTVDLVRNAGYVRATSTKKGVNDSTTDRLELRRMNVRAGTGPFRLRWKLGREPLR